MPLNSEANLITSKIWNRVLWRQALPIKINSDDIIEKNTLRSHSLNDLLKQSVVPVPVRCSTEMPAPRPML